MVSLRTSVIVCTYTDRRLDLLQATLDGVRGQSSAADELVVVIDHNPELADRLRELAPDAVVVESTGPKGLSGARNTGVEVATGDIVVFLDDDAVPRPDWLAELLAPLRDETVAGVGGRAEPAWEIGARPEWMPPELDWVVGCSFEGQEGGDVRNPIGCSMAFRSEVLRTVGGFATELGRVNTLPLGCEETELGLRVNAEGWRIVLTDASVVDHFVPRERATVQYVLRRCYSEGRSKAAVRRLAAQYGTATAGGALSPERRYVRVLARAMARAVQQGVRRRSAQAAAPVLLIPVALAAAGLGFARDSLRRS